MPRRKRSLMSDPHEDHDDDHESPPKRRRSGQLLAFPEELDLFSEPPKQKAIQRNIEGIERSVGVLSEKHPLVFAFKLPPDQFLRLQDTKLYLKYEIKLKREGTDGYISNDNEWKNNVKPNRMLMHTLFNRVSLYINDQEVTATSSGNYHYKAYMQTLLGYSDAALRHNLKYEGSDAAIGNNNIIQRAPNSDTALVELMGMPRLDLAFQPKALLSDVRVKIEFTPTPQDFWFKIEKDNGTPAIPATGGKAAVPAIPPRQYSLEIKLLDAYLKINKSEVSPACLQGIEYGLQAGPARYPFVHVECKDFIIPKGTTSFNFDNICQGRLPRRAFVAFEDNETFNGSKHSELFSFEPNNLNFLACYHGDEQYPKNAYRPEFDKGLCAREFIGLYEALGEDKSVLPILNITPTRFKNKECIFGFNFAQDLSNGSCGYEHVCAAKEGNFSAKCAFKNPTDKVLNAIWLLEWDNIMLMDANRKIEIEAA